MNIFFKYFFICFVLFNLSLFVYANEKIEFSDVSLEKNILKAVIESVDNTKLNKGIFFDASSSIIPKSDFIEYTWDLGDGKIISGINVIHKYDKPGIYDVKLTVKTKSEVSIATKKIWVYNKSFLIFTDAKNLNIDFYNIAAKNAVLVQLINIFDDNISINPAILDAQNILFYVENISNLPYFLNIKNKIDISKKNLFLSIKNSTLISNSFISNIFNLFNVSNIVYISTDVISELIVDKNFNEIINTLKEKGISYHLYDKNIISFSFFNFFSYLINHMIFKGINIDSIYMLLIIPLIVTIAAFFRHIIGISYSGIYLPSILVIIYLFLGIIYGIFLTAIIYLFVYVFRKISKNLRLYIAPYNSFMIILLTIFISILFATAIYFNFFNYKYLINQSIFPLLMLILLSEKFIQIQIDKSFIKSMFLFLDIMIVSFFIYFFVNFFSNIKVFLFMYPDFIFIFLILNYLIGKYKGLRLTEFLYYHFHKTIK